MMREARKGTRGWIYRPREDFSLASSLKTGVYTLLLLLLALLSEQLEAVVIKYLTSAFWLNCDVNAR
jgi:hypothetical protein